MDGVGKYTTCEDDTTSCSQRQEIDAFSCCRFMDCAEQHTAVKKVQRIAVGNKRMMHLVVVGNVGMG